MRDNYGSYLIEDSSITDRAMNIIIDFGVKYTKCGYAGDVEPRKILKTPCIFKYDKFMNESVKYKIQNTEESEDIFHNMKINNNFKNIFSYLRSDYQKIRLELEEFLHNVFYNILQIQKQKNNKSYTVILVIDPFLSKLDKIYEILIKIILENPNIQTVKIYPKNTTPIYCSGFSTGIIVDSGYISSSIIPINEGLPYLDKIENINVSASDLEKELKIFIIDENYTNPISAKSKVKEIDIFSENLNKCLDDLLTRTIICVNKKVNDLLQDPVEFAKIKNEMTKVEFNNMSFNISLMKRVILGSRLFGDYLNDEINFAFSLLKVIKSLNCEDRPKLCGNIVLSGGLTTTFGFYKRFTEEINFILDQNTSEDSEFYELQGIRQNIKFHKVLFSRNILSWIGTSILLNLENINNKHLTITREDVENDNKNNNETISKNDDEFLKRASVRLSTSSGFRVSFRKFEIDKEIPKLKIILNYFRINSRK